MYVETDPEQRADGEEQARLQCRERDQQRDRHGGGPVGQCQASEPIDGCWHDGEAGLDQGHHPAAGHALAHLELGQAE